MIHYSRPLPSGLERPSLLEQFVPDWVFDFIAFGNENILWFVGVLFIILIIKFAIDRKRKQQKQIKKLWLFTLFFLSKRQMMIPLIVTLAKRDGILDEKTLNNLLEIRKQCREISFKKSPKKRLNLEKQVSLILFKYFSSLEKQGKIREKSKFAHVINDLEFIDKKLVELQKVYNNATNAWNHHLKIFPTVFFKLWGFKNFEPFN
jgi:hypothetical protein